MTDQNQFETAAVSEVATTTVKPCGCGGKSAVLNKDLNPRHQALLEKFRQGKFSVNSETQNIDNNGSPENVSSGEPKKRLFF